MRWLTLCSVPAQAWLRPTELGIPGPTPFDMAKAFRSVRSDPLSFLVKVTTKELLEELEAKEAYGRGAEPWEMANIMIFLASDYATYLTGEVISASSQHA